MIFKLDGRAAGYVQKSSQIAVRSPAATFGDVCPDGRNRATQLGSQSKQFLSWELSSRTINGDRQFMCLRPHLQVLKIVHNASLLLLSSNSLIFMPDLNPSTVLVREARGSRLAALLKAFYKILARELPHFPVQLQFKQGSKNFRGGHFVFEHFHELVNLGRLICL